MPTITRPRVINVLPAVLRDFRDPIVEEPPSDPTPPQLRLSVVEVLERLVDRDGVAGVRAGISIWAARHGVDL